jgi:hypothetical protein
LGRSPGFLKVVSNFCVPRASFSKFQLGWKRRNFSKLCHLR